jgi:S1-C subfamily serine protease
MSSDYGQPEAQGPAYPPGTPHGPAATWYGPTPPGGYYGPGYSQLPPPPPPPRPRHRVLAGVAAAVIAFGAGGAAAWAVGVPGTSVGGALVHRELSTASIASMTDPALVDIVSTLGYQDGQAAGTGIVLTSSGEILTNNHVIDGATSIAVTDIGNGQTYRATVTGYDATHDIAVLHLVGASGLQTAKIGDSSGVQVGQKVVALGNAEGRGGKPSVATGQVTALDQQITAQDQGSGTSERLTGVTQTNAPIQPGDSGGPLLNSAGQVIGMDTAASTGNQTDAASGESAQVQAFAIPINQAIATARQISAGTASATVHIGATPFLGVSVSADQQFSGVSGAAVQTVVPGGAAASAGIGGGDVITSVGGRAVTSANSLRDALEPLHPGNRVQVTFVGQSGQQQSVTVTLGSGPAA